MTRALSLALLLIATTAGATDEAKMHFDVQHHFTKSDARARAQMLFDYWHQKYGVQAKWQGYRADVSGQVMGVNIHAELEVADDRIDGDGDDPGPFLRGIARSYITRKLQKYMHPQYEEP